jgi:hypothetical protein
MDEPVIAPNTEPAVKARVKTWVVRIICESGCSSA